jgi:PAS domain S-box-containing protein
MFIWWGPDLIQFYNDAYRQTLGPERHPSALGQRGRECWREIWDIIGPQIELVMAGKGATWHEDALVPVTRHGKREDVWWTYGYSPIDDEAQPNGVGGVLVVCTDVTERMRVTDALRVNQERLQLALDAGVVGIWDWHIPEDTVYADARFAALYGVDPEVALKGAPVSLFVANIHPDDRPRIDREIRHAITSGEEFSSEYRLIQADGSIRWVLARGNCLRENGRAVRFPGSTIDITERKNAELHRELLTDELNHRVKNTLAVVQAIAAQSFKDEVPAAREAFMARLKSISNAHDLLTGERWVGVELISIIGAAIDAYARERTTIRGPNIRLSPSSALALSMAVNELSTNALKYGSLSRPGGSVDVSWAVNGERLELAWIETGGPAVSSPTHKGFGSRLVQDGLAAELNGEVKIAFNPTGVVCTISAPLRSIAQADA